MMRRNRSHMKKAADSAFLCIQFYGSTDKFSRAILTYLFCPHFGGKSSTEHHSASGFPPRSDEKIYANLTDFILSAIPYNPSSSSISTSSIGR